ncbi:MAG TPA: hypothetical protein VFM79_04645 [Pelobium sp.]|nr:hypothetical protein [Pelobium sp.]
MQGLIIAIIIITFLYNVYKNFKKEMEKAKARGKDAEVVQQAEALERKRRTVYEPVIVPPYPTSYDKAVMQEYSEEPVFDNNKQDYFRGKAKAKEIKIASSATKKPVSDYYNPEVPSLEVIQNRKIHQPHKHGFSFPKHKEKHLAAGFNFKQALIYDAILRRPEY